MYRFPLLLVAIAVCVSSVRGADSESRAGKGPVLLSTAPELLESGLMRALMDRFRQDTKIAVELCEEPIKADLRLLPEPVSASQRKQDASLAPGREVFWSTLLVLGPPEGAKRSYGERNYGSWGRGRSPLGTPGTLIAKSSASQLLKEIGLSGHPILVCGSPGWVRDRDWAMWASNKPRANREKTGESLTQTLEIASEKSAYVLSDAATYLRLRRRLKLDVILARDPELRVTYHATLRKAIPQGAAPSAQARRLYDWLVSDSCKAVIRQFQLDEERPFYVVGEELAKTLRGRLDIEPAPTGK